MHLLSAFIFRRFGVACIGAAMLAGAAAGQDPAPTTRPAGEVVRIVRAAPMEGGRLATELINGNSAMQHPAWRAWANWGLGTRAIARLDEVDAQGRTTPVQRYVLRLEAIDREGARVAHRTVGPDGSLAEPSQQFIQAQNNRLTVILGRRSERMVYWRRYEARVAFEKPQDQPAEAIGDQSRRSNRRRTQAVDVRDPAEALPAEFDCAIIETAHLDLEDDPGASDDPASAGPGTAVIVYRSYHNVDAPGWEAILETYRGRLDENGVPAQLELHARWRIERILRPADADPTPEQLLEGLRPQ